jgi:hypothetical protein
MSSVPERNPIGQERLLRPATLPIFVLLVLAVVLGVAWQYGWRGRGAVEESAGEARAQLQSAVLMLQSGQYVGALGQIAPVLANPHNPLYPQARLLQWRIARTRALALPPGSPLQRQAEAQLRPILKGLLAQGGWNSSQWRDLARDAFAVGAYELSAKFWLTAARVDPDNSEQDQQKAAQALAAGGDAGAAGQIFLDLAANTSDPAQRRALFLQGGRWLEGGLGAPAALTRCRALLVRRPELWQERQVVLFMARLALAADQPDLAARWLQRELLQHPEPRGKA